MPKNTEFLFINGCSTQGSHPLNKLQKHVRCPIWRNADHGHMVPLLTGLNAEQADRADPTDQTDPTGQVKRAFQVIFFNYFGPIWPPGPPLNLKPSIKATDHHHDPRTPSWWHWPVLIMLMHDHRPRFCVCTPLHCTPVHDKTGHEWWQRKAVNIPIIGVGVMYFSHILSNVPLSGQKGKIE